jgi:hypothetical protein
MAKSIWYVSFELPSGMQPHLKATETFPSEREARKFARMKLAETPNVSAGTINPHQPQRTVASTQMHEWLEELGEGD